MSEEAPRRTVRRTIPLNQAPRALVRPAPQAAQAAPAAPAFSVEDALDVITESEGFRDTPYRDPYGYWTVGYGTKIGDGSDEALAQSPYANRRSISQAHGASNENEARNIARNMARGTAQEKLGILRNPENLGDSFDGLPRDLQILIVDSAYRGGITGSPNTMRHIREGNLRTASAEFLNNDEYRDALQPDADAPGVAIRMQRLSEALGRLGRERDRNSSFTDAVENRLTQ